jgi:MGT family glycosyltransferase
MSHFLLPCTPIYGHVAPLVSIGRGLQARGHRVSMLTGSKYRAAVEDAGLEFLPIPPEVDYDDARLDLWLSPGPRSGIGAARHAILEMFVRPLVAQHRSLTQALAATSYDAVVCEAAFLGVLPLLMTAPAGQRLPVAGVSVTPMSLTSVDCAPFGSGLDPGRSAHTRRRNRFIHVVLHRGPLRSLHTELDAALRATGVRESAGNYFDQVRRFDVTFQLSVPGMEYPRREMPPTVQFVGPLRPVPPAVALPNWWGDLDGRRVVHVTQGTLANADLGRLLAPALRGLADEDVLVVAATGGRPLSDLAAVYGGPLPDNVRVATFLPYDQLLPRTDVMVTNGGFGGVQQALAYGVPLVVAGDSEDKPEVAGRVAWSGAGLNLRTGSPSPRRVRKAVRAALADPRYRSQAARLQQQIRDHGDPVDTIAVALAELTAVSQHR